MFVFVLLNLNFLFIIYVFWGFLSIYIYKVDFFLFMWPVEGGFVDTCPYMFFLFTFVGVKISHDGINVWKSVKISMNVFTKSNLRKEIFTKSLAVKSYSNLGRTKYRLSQDNGHVSDWPWMSSRMIIWPRTSQARSIRGDQACTRLDRYVATSSQARSLRSDLEPSSIAT